MDSVFIVPQGTDDDVYSKCRFMSDNSPHPIYFPSKKMMLKIMRVCIGV